MVIDSPMLDGTSDSPLSRLCSVCGCRFIPQRGPAHSPAHCLSCERSYNGRRPQRRGRLEPHLCHVCHKTFISSVHLKLHLASHNKDRKYHCGICGKYFKQKSHLETHWLVHTGERPFKCPECGKRFGRAANLKNHRRIHSGERPFQCSICAKAFTQKSGLIAHSQRHANNAKKRPQPNSGPDDLKCGVCCRMFVRSSYFRLRMRLRRGYRPYHCLVCNKTFVKLQSFGNHCDKHLRLKREKKEGKEEMEEKKVSLSPHSFPSEAALETQSSPKAKAKIKLEL